MALDLQKITNELSYFGRVDLIEEDETNQRFLLVMSKINPAVFNGLSSINNVLLRYVSVTYSVVFNYTYIKDDLKVQLSKIQID
jgi:hypothetical protein